MTDSSASPSAPTYHVPSEERPPPPRRFVTSHDEQGKAFFWIEGDVPFTTFRESSGKDAIFSVPWITEGFPVNNQTTEDTAYPVGAPISRPNTITSRFVDFAPESSSPTHRTQSFDYGVVLFGDLECELDNGEIRKLKQSDVVIQRGTVHRWHNRGKLYARMLFILVTAEPILIDGKPLGDAMHDD